jgi:hypothetical protein
MNTESLFMMEVRHHYPFNLHIGIAAAQGADYLLTWNFKHINNAEMRSAITKVVESCGLACPQICSPEELGGTSND